MSKSTIPLDRVAPLITALVICASPIALSAEDAEIVVFTGGTLIDGNGGTPVDNAAVVIQGDRILFAGPEDEIEIPTTATVYDLDRLTILPGFFNTHVHEASFTQGAPGQLDLSRLAVWAHEGVTTLRDVTSPRSELIRYRQAESVHNDPFLARLLMAGPCIEVPGGRAETYNRLIIYSPEDAREKIERLLDDGADVVKLYFEDGSIFGESWNVMTTEEARMIVKVAHGRGKTVTVHVQEAYLVEKALDAGVDDICHSQVDEPVPDRLIERMAEQGVSLVPTLEMSNTWRPALEMSWINLRRMVELGVDVGMGTDYSYNFDIEFEVGMPLREMQLMERGGITPMQIIVAGTRNSARVCGLGHELGTIENAKIADLIVVDGDPLQDLTVLKHEVMMVIHNGVVIRDDRPSAQIPRRVSGRRAPGNR
jgi:imidazolonepropionase-like amidohydrolase